LIRCSDDSQHSSRDPGRPTSGESLGVPSAKPRGSLSASAAPRPPHHQQREPIPRGRTRGAIRLFSRHNLSAGTIAMHSILDALEAPRCPVERAFVPSQSGRLSPHQSSSASAAAGARAQEKPARRRHLADGLVLATTWRVVVSSMSILPTEGVAVESTGDLEPQKSPAGRGWQKTWSDAISYWAKAGKPKCAATELDESSGLRCRSGFARD
jgi:hypothetical protein